MKILFSLNTCVSNWIYWLLLIFLLGFSFGCQDNLKVEKHLQPSFYYWKSIFKLNTSDLAFVKEMKIKRLYVKFFDVKQSPQKNPMMVARIKADWTTLPKELELCPVVYIVNDVFLTLDEKGIADLAENIAGEIKSITKDKTFGEIQMDCDWSGKTQTKYFYFLRKIKSLFPSKVLSGTIRLHQVKYRETSGIPPLDRGILMIYNLYNPTKYTSINSIFDQQEVQKYIQNQPVYPIKMDIALPIFSWGIHFEHRRFKGFLNNLNGRKVSKMTFLKKTKDNFYQVIQDTIVQNQYLRIGDVIKVEEVKMDDLLVTLKNSLALLPNDTFNLSLFHLDENIIKNYNDEKIKALFEVCD